MNAKTDRALLKRWHRGKIIQLFNDRFHHNLEIIERSTA
jgi:hypothetical protein